MKISRALPFVAVTALSVISGSALYNPAHAYRPVMYWKQTVEDTTGDAQAEKVGAVTDDVDIVRVHYTVDRGLGKIKVNLHMAAENHTPATKEKGEIFIAYSGGSVTRVKFSFGGRNVRVVKNSQEAEVCKASKVRTNNNRVRVTIPYSCISMGTVNFRTNTYAVDANEKTASDQSSKTGSVTLPVTQEPA